MSGADLSGKDFSNTSFQYANLDNVNFTGSNFSYCNLTDVRIEETAPVQSIAISPTENILALYQDGIIREWEYQQRRRPNSTNLAADIYNTHKFFFLMVECLLSLIKKIDRNDILRYNVYVRLKVTIWNELCQHE